MSANASVLTRRVKGKGWRRGLHNLLQGENSAWFRSSRWWKHILMWVVIINGMMAIMLIATVEAAKVGEQGPPVLPLYGLFGGMFAAFGVMIIMQRVLVAEKSSGTAAWVLSKPVTRTAFVVSRLVVNSIAILLTSVMVPGMVFYIMLGLFSEIGWLSPFGFMAAFLMFSLHTFYWITLVWMMGTLSESSSVVIAVPMVVFFTFWMGPGLIPQLMDISPLMLVASPDLDHINALAVSFLTGTPVYSWLPLIATIASCVIFIIVAIHRFNRQEF